MITKLITCTKSWIIIIPNKRKTKNITKLTGRTLKKPVSCVTMICFNGSQNLVYAINAQKNKQGSNQDMKPFAGQEDR